VPLALNEEEAARERSSQPHIAVIKTTQREYEEPDCPIVPLVHKQDLNVRVTASQPHLAVIETVQRPQHKQRSIIEPKVKEPMVVYKSFPHPHAPLREDLLPWARKGAYFIMYDKSATNGYDTRFFHRHCPGVYGSPSRSEMKASSEREPVIVLNLTTYPTLMHDNEWSATLRRLYPEYLNCVCPFHKHMMHGEGIVREYYEISKPYFYLTGLNEEGEDCLRRTRLLSEVR